MNKIISDHIDPYRSSYKIYCITEVCKINCDIIVQIIISSYITPAVISNIHEMIH